MAPRELAALAQPLATLGITVPDPHSVPPDLRLTPDQWVLLSRDLDGDAPWVDELGPLHVLRAARRLSMPVTRVLEMARPLIALGFALPEGGALPPDHLTGERPIRLLALDFRYNWGVGIRDTIGIARVLRAARVWSLTVDAVLDLARPLAGLGITLPEPGLVPRGLSLNDRQWALVDWIDDQQGASSPAALARFAAEQSLTLTELTELAAPLVSLGPLPPWPDAAGPWLQDRETVRTLGRLDQLVTWDDAVLDPLPLAYHCVAESQDPSEFLDALQLLKALGIDTDEAIDYARYCAEHR